MQLEIISIIINAILTTITLVSCVGAIKASKRANKFSIESEFYARLDKVQEIWKRFEQIYSSDDYTLKFVDELNSASYDLLNEIDNICKRFPYELIEGSEIANHIKFVKDHKDDFEKAVGSLSKSPDLEKTMNKLYP